jgi:serine/threonine protein phosphatase PrpC
MIQVASLSLQGRRNSNQDRVFISKNDKAGESIVAAVADGLGGMIAGDKAAQIAVDTLGEETDALLVQVARNFDQARLFAAEVCQRANDKIGDWAEANVGEGNVGTTLVTLIASGSRYLVVNVGDSRCYFIDDNSVRQLTQDHTVADSLVKQGALSLADYDSSPLRNQLTRSLGPNPTSNPDFFPNTQFGTIKPRCTFLLCSDGFYSKLKDSDLMKLQNSPEKLEDVLKSRAEAALERDSTDNVSAVAVRFEK